MHRMLRMYFSACLSGLGALHGDPRFAKSNRGGAKKTWCTFFIFHFYCAEHAPWVKLFKNTEMHCTLLEITHVEGTPLRALGCCLGIRDEHMHILP